MNSPLLIFADDWGRHPSSCQHLVGRLLDRHAVTWVNTIGTRTPKFDLATVKRGLGKVRQWFHKQDAPGESPKIDIVNPRMWPWFTRKMDRRLNRKLLVNSLRPILDQMTEPPIAVTALPLVADIMDDLPVKHWIYYCVDDFSEWPGLDRAVLKKMERIVVDRAEGLIAVSEHLQDRLRRMGRAAELLTHGVDLEFWRTNAVPATPSRIVFWGVLDRRMDTAWVRALSERLTEGTIVLVGPEQDVDPQLKRLPNVEMPGPVAFEELPVIASTASVLIMPYANLPVTRAMQPLKLKEYLATGKPVVVRDLPATRDWADALDAVSNAESFAERVIERLKTALPEVQARARVRLADSSWNAKARLFESMIEMHQPTLIGSA